MAVSTLVAFYILIMSDFQIKYVCFLALLSVAMTVITYFL